MAELCAESVISNEENQAYTKQIVSSVHLSFLPPALLDHLKRLTPYG